MRRHLLLLITGLAAIVTQGQPTGSPAVEGLSRTTLFGVGGASVMDTYLSPYAYTGPSLSVAMTTERPTHWGYGLTTMARYAVEGTYAKSPVSGAHQWDGNLRLAGGCHYNWTLADGRLRLAAGALVEFDGGGTYSTIGGNNPAQAHIGADLAASGIAAYTFSVKERPWQAALQADVPLVGAQFAMQYGQSYYELFHQNHWNGNLRCTYPGNAPSLRLQATLAIPVRKSRLVVGYGGDVRQYSLNGIRRHAWYNQFLIGFSRKLKLL